MTKKSIMGWLNAVCQQVKQQWRRRSVLRAANGGNLAPLLADAESALAQSVWHCGADHPETGRKLAALAAIHAMRGEHEDALPLLRRAIAVLSASSQEDPAEVFALQEQLGELLRAAKDYRAAETVYVNLLSVYIAKHKTRTNANVARILDALALTRKGLGKTAEAKAGHRDALLIWETVCGSGSPEVARCLTHLATLFLSERCYDEAEPLLLRAVATWERSPNPHDLYAIITLSCCGDLYRSTGRGEQAQGVERAAKAMLARYAK
ncbi:MAG: tetratricopeptide repeat protein [Armatimonadetes bacterium]|nr:tetratricopeptide repeat protein [Armatimonadota bacterium]